MTDDSTLTDFLEDRATSDESDDGGVRGDRDRDAHGDSELETHGTTGRETHTAAGRETQGDSGLSTYAWGAYTCRDCGDAVERVWRDDADFVCSSCKSW